MPPVGGHLCSRCGDRIPSDVVRDLCGECDFEAPKYQRAIAYGAYEGGLRELIHLLKFDQVKPAAGVLGRMLCEAISDLAPDFGDTAPLIVPVPLHESKMRQRGFNQSEMIAQVAIRMMPGGLQFSINSRALVRRRPTMSQIGLTPDQRRANIKGAFAVERPNEISGRDILLVDDVMTTGTTVSECARVLLKAGAARVWVATVARALKAEPMVVLPHQDEESQPAIALSAHAG